MAAAVLQRQSMLSMGHGAQGIARLDCMIPKLLLSCLQLASLFADGGRDSAFEWLLQPAAKQQCRGSEGTLVCLPHWVSFKLLGLGGLRNARMNPLRSCASTSTCSAQPSA